MWLHGNLGLLMNTTYPLWFESFHPAEKIQKASLPAPAAFLYPSQWFTPTQLLYLINKHLTTAASLGVLTLERPRQAWAGHQLWQQETAPETTLGKQQLQKPSPGRHKEPPVPTLVWGIRACVRACGSESTSLFTQAWAVSVATGVYQTLWAIWQLRMNSYFDLQCSYA